VQHCAHLVRGQVDVCFAVVALHEAVAVAMSLNSSFDSSNRLLELTLFLI
jgi:hypothetical protein